MDGQRTNTVSTKKWTAVTDKIEALSPVVVIPARANTQTALNIRAVKHTKNYIQFFEEALKKIKLPVPLVLQ